MRLIPLKLTKLANAIYRGFSGEIVSVPGVGVAVHDGSNEGGVLLTEQIEAGVAGRDNFVRNSNFWSIQNGDVFIGNAGFANYTLDGWYINHNGGSTSNVARVAGYDLETDSSNQLRVTTFSGGGSDAFSILTQTYHHVQRFAGKVMTLSFWVKPNMDTSITTEFLLSFADPGTVNRGTLVGRHSLKANVWNKVEATFQVPAINSGDVIDNNTDNARLNFWLDAGDDWNDRTGGILPFSGTMDFANVKIERGNRATEYRGDDRLYEDLKVKEYFEKHTSTQFMTAAGTTTHTVTCFINVAYDSPKWTTIPTITYSLDFASGDSLASRRKGGFTLLANSTSAASSARVLEYTANAEISP